MNIALFSDCYVPIKNGVVTSMKQLKDGLEEKGHKVVVATVAVPDFDKVQDDVLRVKSIPLGMGTEQRIGLVNQFQINKFLKKHKVEIIHTHSEFPLGLSGRRAAKWLHLPHVHTTHTMWKDYAFYFIKNKQISEMIIHEYFKKYLSAVNVVVSPSIKAKKYYSSINSKPPYAIIPNGVDVSHFKEVKMSKADKQGLFEKYNIKENDIVLIFTGRIGREKRVDILLKTIAPVLKKNMFVKMLFVGDGPELESLKQFSKDNGIGESVIFTGFINWKEMYKYYSLAHLYVTLSLSEVHPMTLIEAAMTGVPAVTRLDDSYLSLIKDGKNGFLCSNDEELAVKIEYLVNNREELGKFSKEALRLSKKFTAENHVSSMEKLYEKVINAYPGYPNVEDFE